MTTQVVVAADLLFPSAGNPMAANIKFCAGWNRAVDAEEIAAEFLRVEALVDAGGIEPSDGIDD